MKRKKLVALVVSGLLAVGVAGGTLAWFTSSDAVDNLFKTGGLNDGESSAIDIYEKFEQNQKIVPGDLLDKIVQVKNTCDYPQLIRVKLTPINNATQQEITGDDLKEFNKQITLKFFDGAIKDATGVTDYSTLQDGWIKDGDYYYYMGNVTEGKFTSGLLQGIQFNDIGDANNSYRNKDFDIKVEAEGVQASHEAFKDTFNVADTDSQLYKILKSFQDGPKNGVDQIEGTVATK
ncbi:MAG: BsaA family SipW-dependent biofilm matrix protein [Clostridiaceae bacterium]|nr:BsaA family SipW-dependent biofilm matrix protein [Clostridiaceae bacterium]